MGRKAKGGHKPNPKAIGRQRIHDLQAVGRSWVLQGRMEDASTAGRHLLRLRRRLQIPFSRSDRVTNCRGCGLARSSQTSRVRVRAGRVITTCTSCGDVHRRPLG